MCKYIEISPAAPPGFSPVNKVLGIEGIFYPYVS